MFESQNKIPDLPDLFSYLGSKSITADSSLENSFHI